MGSRFGVVSVVGVLVAIPLGSYGQDLQCRTSVYRELERGNPCARSECTLSATSGQTFSFSYEIVGQDSVTLTLNGVRHGPLPVADVDSLLESEYFPFGRCRFYDDHRFGLYVLDSQQAASNLFHHFFVLGDGGAFHYLGEHGYMTYDESTMQFTVLEAEYRSAPRGRGTSTYMLQDNELRCVEGACEQRP